MPMILLIIDGLPDILPTDSQPFYEGAGCKNLADMRKNGAYGCFDTVPEGFPVDSLTCIATLLGVSANSLPRGRAYLEALSCGIPVAGDTAVCRCNLVEVDEHGVLVSSCAQGVLPTVSGEYALHHMSGYKNLLVCPCMAQYAVQTLTKPPHEHIGEPVDGLLPAGTPLADALRGVALDSAVVRNHQTRMLYPWDVTTRHSMPQFSAVHGVSGAAVCAAEIVRGIALGMGLAAITPVGATGEADTSLEAKAQTALELAKRYDFVLVHVNGADELAHRRDAAGKAEFLARVDQELAGVLLAGATADTVLLVTSDHATLSDTGRHAGGPQPFVLYGGAARGNLGRMSGEDAVALMKQAAEKHNLAQ